MNTMTERDTLASAALIGLLSEHVPAGNASTTWALTKHLKAPIEQALAIAAYKLADAMLEQRCK